MHFVWLTDNYRVNLESIFSMEKKYVSDYTNIDNWNSAYDNWFNDIIENGIHEDDGINKDFDKENISDDDYKFIIDYIKTIIGECPDPYIIEYCIILSTGVKLNIAEDKFLKIQEAIDKLS